MNKFSEIINIKPIMKKFKHTLDIPGSKSLSNRALLIAAVAEGTSVLTGLLDSQDTVDAINTLENLGVILEKKENNYIVQGCKEIFPVNNTKINLGSAGTLARFLPGLLASQNKGEWIIDASEQLSKRPILPLLEAINEWGAEIEFINNNMPIPFKLKAKGLNKENIKISAEKSSQFASGLIMAMPLAKKYTKLTVTELDPDEPYIDMTVELMEKFGVNIKKEKIVDKKNISLFSCKPQNYKAENIVIEADFNTANYFFALAALTKSNITVKNLNIKTKQPGIKFLEVLEKMGAKVIKNEKYINVIGQELPLKGGFSIDMRTMAEMAPTLAVLAVFADKPIEMNNLKHIRGHETDRITAVCKNLNILGVKCQEFESGLKVYPQNINKINNAKINPYQDHRLAMSFAVMGAAAKGISIENPACVSKTCPVFFKLLANLDPEII